LCIEEPNSQEQSNCNSRNYTYKLAKKAGVGSFMSTQFSEGDSIIVTTQHSTSPVAIGFLNFISAHSLTISVDKQLSIADIPQQANTYMSNLSSENVKNSFTIDQQPFTGGS
jgi:hypothetical protein